MTVARLQHFGWFFARGFGPQGWGRPYWEWGYDWRRPELYRQAARELDQAGLDILVIEDAISLGTDETLDLRIRSAYGGPKPRAKNQPKCCRRATVIPSRSPRAGARPDGWSARCRRASSRAMSRSPRPPHRARRAGLG